VLSYFQIYARGSSVFLSYLKGRNKRDPPAQNEGQVGELFQQGQVTFERLFLRQSQYTWKNIVHELLHLKYLNNGKMLRALLHAYTSDKK